MDATLTLWLALGALVAVAFVVDFKLFEPGDHERPSMRRAVWWSAGWLVLALGFGAYVWIDHGSGPGGEFLTGYLLERSLSLDNLFVFALIFAGMGVAPADRQRLLTLGIVIALVLRGVFIVVGAELVETLHVVLYLFGAILLYTGVRMALHRHDEDAIDPDRNPGVRLLRRVAPGASAATAVIVAIAAADVIFAVDSIPAIFGVTTDTFVVFSANAFALLGMRALYALLEGAADRFEHLKTGLAFILVFIGAKMLVEDLVHIPVAVSLLVIVTALAASVLASLRAPGDGPGPGPGDAHGEGTAGTPVRAAVPEPEPVSAGGDR
ncbi:TerC family protein [Paraconexibacter antarcticus]|uniref:TerC family protein n=1 Tax=Paraconexibacter antarcticus TaxID=2949664 RepID=A0ABY5E0A6_9ACTN|nr:TerC family protein [Paraconexibacter antarcticus]UTI66587.1 TerC family protein [Paraconexibacter antarcticus]